MQDANRMNMAMILRILKLKVVSHGEDGDPINGQGVGLEFSFFIVVEKYGIGIFPPGYIYNRKAQRTTYDFVRLVISFHRCRQIYPEKIRKPVLIPVRELNPFGTTVIKSSFR